MAETNKTYKNEIRINTLEHKVGITENGILTGNGVLGEIKKLKEEDTFLEDKLNKISIMQKELSLRFDVLENDIKEITNLLNKMNAEIDIIKTEMKDNINFRTIGKAKNIFIGIAGFILALGTIGMAISSGVVTYLISYFRAKKGRTLNYQDAKELVKKVSLNRIARGGIRASFKLGWFSFNIIIN